MPDDVVLVVEVLSPSNAVSDLVDKRLILLSLAGSQHEYRQEADGESVEVPIVATTTRPSLAP